MPSPFPGMDPFIETQGNWQDFHNSLISEIRATLGVRLPEEYLVQCEERVEVVGFNESSEAHFRPDLLISRERGFKPGPTTVVLDAPAYMEIEVAATEVDEVSHTWLEIRKLPDLKLVTVIEVLSPVNKVSPGYHKYIQKRNAIFKDRVNLVEIDLLIMGARPLMKKPLPPAHYYAIIARGEKHPVAEVYPWTIWDCLPKIPIPLSPPDADVPIDLQEFVGRVYETGRYHRLLKYQQPLPATFPISAEDRAWAEGLGAKVTTSD